MESLVCPWNNGAATWASWKPEPGWGRGELCSCWVNPGLWGHSSKPACACLVLLSFQAETHKATEATWCHWSLWGSPSPSQKAVCHGMLKRRPGIEKGPPLLWDLRPGSCSGHSTEISRRNRQLYLQILLPAVCLLPLEVFETEQHGE